jgi:long-subunit fatty acid transport protein
MNTMKKLLLMIFICLPVSLSAFEKTGTTSLQFLSIRPSARAAAMAGAYTASVDNSDACFWNPAALTKISDQDASVSFIDYFLDVKMYAFSYGMTTTHYGSFGIFGLYSDIGEIEVTRADARGFSSDRSNYNVGLTGEVIRPFQMVAGVSYGLELTKAFSFGLTVKYAEENLVYYKVRTVVFDGGIHFETGYRSIEIAAAIKNFGQDVKFIANKFPIPQTLNLGVSAYVIGAAGNNLFMDSEENSVLFEYDITQLRDYDQQHIVGLEYSFKNMIQLRAGYKFNGDQETYSLGCGVKYQNLRFDYSYNPYGDYLPAVHRVTVGFAIH